MATTTVAIHISHPESYDLSKQTSLTVWSMVIVSKSCAKWGLHAVL